jgi:hypothetical protein
MVTLRAISAALGLGLLGLILWASLTGQDIHGTIFDQGGVILSLPWGLMTMADLYVGFVLFAIIMFIAEKSWISGLMWSLPLLVLGNVWAALWLVIRLPSLVRRINRPDWPES